MSSHTRVRFEFNKTNTFCISLATHTDRWNRMKNRLKWFGIEATRWHASTPHDLMDPFNANLNPFQKACSQSHIHIWRHIIKTELPYALILEDDAMFDREWLYKLNKYNLYDQPTEWDAIFLNGSEPIIPPHKWVKCTEQYLTGAYIISLSGANKILNQYAGCFHAADWMTTRLQLHGQSYCYFPWLVIQEGIESTIGSNVDADHAKVVSCLNAIDYNMTDHYL